MKTLILSGLAALALLSFTACTVEEEHHGRPTHVTTTTTEETTVRQPVLQPTGTTVETETRTVRPF